MRGLFTSLLVAGLSLAGLWQTAAQTAGAPEREVRIVVLGDSLSAGYQLPAADAFPARLQAALKARGRAVQVDNAGVSGDTSTGGLERLDWSVGEGTDAVILELGGNDALRGIDPAITRRNLEAIIERLKARRVPILLAGMLAPPNMGAAYAEAFNPIFPELAAKYGLILDPFFLEGVMTVAGMTLPDGMHPNARGVGVMVERILPKVEDLIAQARAGRGS